MVDKNTYYLMSEIIKVSTRLKKMGVMSYGELRPDF